MKIFRHMVFGFDFILICKINLQSLFQNAFYSSLNVADKSKIYKDLIYIWNVLTCGGKFIGLDSN